MYIRKLDIDSITDMLEIFPVTALLGARQIGKTTLSRQFKASYYYDLENPDDALLFANPTFALKDKKGLIVIDEIQRMPELFPVLRYITDNNPDQRFLILGSASQDLMKKGSESLAGRIGYYFLGGLRLEDVGYDYQSLWLKGSFPKAFIQDESRSYAWRENFIISFLEKDIPQLGINIPSNTLRRFWMMLGHYNGQILNYSELARSFGISDMTVRHYLEILEGTFMIRLLQPYFENVGKRVVKNPKLYFRDTGILHTLMSVKNHEQLMVYNKLGASWEGFVMEQVISHIGKYSREFFFWKTHSGSEIDLIWLDGGKKYGVEIKYSESPDVTRSLKTVMNDLKLEKTWIIYPGEKSFEADQNIFILPVTKLSEMVLQ